MDERERLLRKRIAKDRGIPEDEVDMATATDTGDNHPRWHKNRMLAMVAKLMGKDLA